MYLRLWGPHSALRPKAEPQKLYPAEVRRGGLCKSISIKRISAQPPGIGALVPLKQLWYAEEAERRKN